MYGFTYLFFGATHNGSNKTDNIVDGGIAKKCLIYNKSVMYNTKTYFEFSEYQNVLSNASSRRKVAVNTMSTYLTFSLKNVYVTILTCNLIRKIG